MAGDTTDIRRVSIDAIEVASRLRAIDFQVIIRLAESMTEIGLMNPITVMVTRPATDSWPVAIGLKPLAG